MGDDVLKKWRRARNMVLIGMDDGDMLVYLGRMIQLNVP